MDLDLDLDSTSLFEQADKSKVPPILQKRIIAFVNHFILKTCTFLNNFVEECETRFIETERKMQKLEATLIILEEKLASIPDIDKEQKSNIETSDESVQHSNVPVEENDKQESETMTETTESVEKPPTDVKEIGIKAKEDARYKTFFKMLQVGVPPPAIKLKMESEGLNSNILDTPNIILTDGIPCEQQPDS